MATRTIYRDSGNGQIISKRDFDRRPPATVEREKVRVSSPKPSSSKKGK
jgi:hypothetical protein